MRLNRSFEGFLTEGETVTPPAGGGGPASEAGAAKFELPANWRDSLPADLKDDPTIKLHNSIEGIAKTLVNSQKILGADKMLKPHEHFSDEDWKNFYKTAGVPEEKDYKLDFKPEDNVKADEKFLEFFKKAAVKEKLFPKQATGLLKEVGGFLENAQKELQTAEKVKTEGELAAFKKEAGAAYETMVKKANLAFKTWGDESMGKLLETTGLGNHPAMIKMFSKVAELMKEGQMRGDDGSGGGELFSKKEAMKKAMDMLTNASHPLNDKKHPNHGAAQAEYTRLFEMAHHEE